MIIRKQRKKNLFNYLINIEMKIIKKGIRISYFKNGYKSYSAFVIFKGRIFTKTLWVTHIEHGYRYEGEARGSNYWLSDTKGNVAQFESEEEALFLLNDR